MTEVGWSPNGTHPNRLLLSVCCGFLMVGVVVPVLAQPTVVAQWECIDRVDNWSGPIVKTWVYESTYSQTMKGAVESNSTRSEADYRQDGLHHTWHFGWHEGSYDAFVISPDGVGEYWMHHIDEIALSPSLTVRCQGI